MDQAARQEPYWDALERERVWSGSERDYFRHPQSHEDYFRHPQSHEGICLLKVSHLYHRDREGHYYEQRWAVNAEGEMKGHITTPLSVKGFQTSLPSEALSKLRVIVPTLPPSDRTISPGNGVIFGFPEKGVWTTRVYDKTSLSPQAASLAGTVGITLR